MGWGLKHLEVCPHKGRGFGQGGRCQEEQPVPQVLGEDVGKARGGVEPRGGGGATGRRGRSLGEGVRAYLMVIWGRSPPSAFSPIRISRMVWDQ